MKIHHLAVEEALRSVHSSAVGLAGAEASRRLREFGPNVVEKAPPTPVLAILVRDFGHFFALVLWLCAALAFVAEYNEPGQGMARVGIAVIGVILVSGVFSFWQERRVERTLAALRGLLPRRITVMRDGSPEETGVEELVPGDVILLKQGDRVPADCRLIESYAVRVDVSTVTGESAPKARHAGPCSEEDLPRGTNILLAGTSLVSGEGRAVVFATGMDTEFGKIAHLAQRGAHEDSPLRRELAHLSRLIVCLAVAVGGSFFAAGSMLGMPLWRDVLFSIGIFVAMVPEGLLPTLTLALVLAAQRMAKRNVLIRQLPSVETLGSTTVIVTDKTGTLTENRMRVVEAMLGLESAPLSQLEGRQLDGSSLDFFRVARFCNSLAAQEGEAAPGGPPWKRRMGDPLETALAGMALRFAPGLPAPRRVGELPFDSHRMRQAVAFQTPDGMMLYCKGAVETVLPLCGAAARGPEAAVAGEGGAGPSRAVGMPAGEAWAGAAGPATAPLDAAARAFILAAQESMAGRGLRVIALAAKRLPEGEVTQESLAAQETGLTFLGLAALEDPPRPEVPDAVRRCREAGIKVVMATGDHPRTAVAVARAIGLSPSENPRVVTGEELRRISGAQLQLALDAPEIVFARLAAAQKMRIVNALKKKGHVVAVTGDGVNDAPAFRAAHIGIAMGLSGADVAKESADMVLLDDNFASIVNAVEEGRAIFKNIRKFLTYVLVHNVAELVPYLAFALFRVPLALTPIQMLAVDMGTDSLTALGLGAEAPDPDVMREPPRPRGERLLNLPLALRAYLFLGLIEASAVMAAFFYVLTGGGWTFGQDLSPADPLYLKATTASLGAIIAVQAVNVFLCRSDTRGVFSMPLGGNRLILWGVALEIVLLVLFAYTPLGNLVLETAPPAWEVWLLVLPFMAAMVVLEEGRKWLARRAGARGAAGR